MAERKTNAEIMAAGRLMPAGVSNAEKRRNEIDALLSGYWAKADQAWLNALLKVSDEASDADKEVVWATVVEIAWVRGWKWSHGEGRWVRKDADRTAVTGSTVLPDVHFPTSGPKTPGLPT